TPPPRRPDLRGSLALGAKLAAILTVLVLVLTLTIPHNPGIAKTTSATTSMPTTHSHIAPDAFSRLAATAQAGLPGNLQYAMKATVEAAGPQPASTNLTELTGHTTFANGQWVEWEFDLDWNLTRIESNYRRMTFDYDSQGFLGAIWLADDNDQVLLVSAVEDEMGQIIGYKNELNGVTEMLPGNNSAVVATQELMHARNVALMTRQECMRNANEAGNQCTNKAKADKQAALENAAAMAGAAFAFGVVATWVGGILATPVSGGTSAVAGVAGSAAVGMAAAGTAYAIMAHHANSQYNRDMADCRQTYDRAVRACQLIPQPGGVSPCMML
ncbi:MAG: hypothetical protein MH204_07375, partial [Fimbriimonadaceae bacterium]|nr:hypothetical protein [Fimbriimonadaceae bacterium]